MTGDVHPTPQPSGAPTVLIVEDEELLRNVLRRLLTREGYRTVEATNGSDALILLRADASAGTIRLVVSDCAMPVMGGLELAARVLEEQLGVGLLLMSGYSDDVLDRDGGIPPGVCFIKKPFSSPELLLQVRRLLQAAG